MPAHSSAAALSLLFLLSQVSPSSTAPSPFPAVFAFGDSILDTGNNNVLKTIVKCDFPPYGQDFPRHAATGRFSNGKVPSDMIVSTLGIKELLPPYLTTNDSEELLTGVSFASGGSGYDPLTPSLLSLLSMSDQLELFKRYKTTLDDIAGAERAAKIISDSLYVVSGGNNDVVNTYFDTPLRRLSYDLPTYLSYLAISASSFIQGLYYNGARHIGVMGLPPLGCLPSQRTLAGGDFRGCVPQYNLAALQYNNQLSAEVQRLNNTLPGAMIVYVNIYSSLLDIMQQPQKYGFQESTKGCCGTGKLEMSVLCNSWTASTCQNDSAYVFWDSFHPTQRTYEILISDVRREYSHLFS